MSGSAGTSGAAALEPILAAIEALTPAQRRDLQRWLHATGLFVAEELVTDQHRLRVATAVRDPELPGAVRLRQSSIFDGSAEAAPPARATPPPAQPARDEAPARPQPEAARPAAPPAPPPVPATPVAPPTKPAGPTGRVVLGTPQPADKAATEMAPLPGMAPEAAIAIVFDGGSRGNPGEGYGSYQLRWPGAPPQLTRLQFGSDYTNNEAEYDTLIRALEDVHKRLHQSGAALDSARVEVRGDSKLVIQQVLGNWKCKDERMARRCAQVRKLLAPLGGWSLKWHDRSNSVRDLGH